MNKIKRKVGISRKKKNNNNNKSLKKANFQIPILK